ncbi:MAG: YitT family protein [Lachnospiraceae bacterium]|nr:YitT family protein [Lachnospiraceae bacterium]
MKKDTLELIKSILYITAGAIIAAFAVEEFLAPNKIFDGGVVGVSMILSHFLPVKLGILTFIVNIPFLLYALKHIGHAFLAKAVYAMLLFSIFVGIFEPFTATTYDNLLATVFGGVILGTGVGLVLRGGGCLDGTEIVGILVGRKTSLSTGNVIFAINIVIYAIAGLIFGIDSGFYSILMYFITSKVIDMIETGMEQAKSIMIVTEDGKQIADAIYQNFGRTVTFIKGEGLVSGTEKDILYCVVTRAEIYDLKKMLTGMRVEAFSTVSDISEIIGNHVKTTHSDPSAL